MKKLILILILALFVSSASFAESKTESKTVSVTVPPVFELAVSGTRTSVDFGSLDVGTGWTQSDFIEVTCKSNNGNTWYLKINNTQPFTLDTDATQTIDNDNLKWFGTYTTGTGTLVTTATSMSLNPATVYTCSSTEKVNTPNGTPVQIAFGLGIPNDIQAGNYTTTIVFTITE